MRHPHTHHAVHQNHPDKQPVPGGVRETESIFDDVNGSFHLGDNPDPNALEFINAEEKLQGLAI